MNLPTNRATASTHDAGKLHPYYEEAPAAFEKSSPAQPSPIRYRKTLVLEPGAEIASHLCLKTGRPTRHQLTLSLRNPWNPGTWFADHGKIEIGLSRRSLETFRLTRALAWSLIGIGIILTGGAFFYGIPALVTGLLLCVAGLMVRAAFPVWCPVENELTLVIQGCGEGFLRHYPTKSEV